MMYKDGMDIQIVVARYKEPLDWLNSEPFNKCSIVVYNKGDDDDFLHSKNIVREVKLPNIGFDPHSFLYHIVNNYENLANITAFFQGSINLNQGSVNKYNRAVNLIDHCFKNNCTAMSVTVKSDNVRDEMYNFTLDHHCVSNHINLTNKNSQTVPCKIRPFGKWFASMFGDICIQNIAYNHIIAIKREDIIKKPKEFYQNLLDFLSDIKEGEQPEVIHYFERAWEAIFYPLEKHNFI